jgi:L-lactate dehydrogenase complex protein LldG
VNEQTHQHGDREGILTRIRRALQVPAPFPGHHTAHDRVQEQQPDAPLHAAPDGTNPLGSNLDRTNWNSSDRADLHEPPSPAKNAVQSTSDGANGNAGWSQTLTVLPSAAWREWLPRVGESFDEQAALFARNAAELKADFQLLDETVALQSALTGLRDREGWQRVATQRGEWTERAAEILGLATLYTDDGYDAAELEQCEVGISLCDALVAQTGSVLLTSRSAGGRALSVLPPHHVVLARRDQMVPDLSTAFEILRSRYGDEFPSLMTFITGPSRTGDIERILVLGAHGPKQLTIICF